ncbi:MAG: 3-dehydroquinate synthase [Lachnospiraceae bacterium]|nr:3-dehydroquinate synthase [Lachnospiraceae bacterium]
MLIDSLTVHLDNKPIYDITFNDSFDKLSDTLCDLGYDGRKLCIVTETNIASLYLDAILILLEKSGHFEKIISFIFEEGEQSKNLDVVRDLYEKLIIEKFDRKDVLIALGGGVTGDLTGYAAATYLRGIDFIQIPTSLLSQVDSSVGGKTGVDFKSYKNMVGAFYMPKLVYMNLNVLKTLDKRQLVSGMGEVIKYGLILDKPFYDWVKSNYDNINAYDYNTLCEMVYRSCDNKRLVVEEDPTEKGRRALLNFGHTLGHALEKYMNFELLHGECVLIGSVLASIISYNKGNIDEETLMDIITTISTYDIPKLPCDIDINTIIEYTKNDKKVVGDKIKFILLKNIGNAYIDMNVSSDDMKKAFEEYMNKYN